MIHWIARFLILFVAITSLMGTESAQVVPLGHNFIATIRDIIFSTLASNDFQWMVMICLFLSLIFLVITLNMSEKECTEKNGAWCPGIVSFVSFFSLAYVASIAGISYIQNYSVAVKWLDAIVFVAGLVFSLEFKLLTKLQQGSEGAKAFQKSTLWALIVFLLVAAFVQPGFWVNSSYRGEVRWSGLWSNPNTYGLLMATGSILCTGLAVPWFYQRVICKGPSTRIADLTSIFLGLAGLLMMVGLLKSYSRGAWLASMLALGYLAIAWSKATGTGLAKISAAGHSRWSNIFLFRRRNRLPLIIILLSLLALGFLNFSGTQERMAQRLFSIGNPNDFSQRNRMQAYEGALQMMADKPFFGYGWNMPQLVYDQFYKPSWLVEGWAIALNDYFMLGETLGLPALVCFIAYIGLCLGSLQARGGYSDEEWNGRIFVSVSDTWISITCRAGLLTLLTGFWFNRGLCFLALAIPFWILFEIAKGFSTTVDQVSLRERGPSDFKPLERSVSRFIP
jgi:O-antigen ligase